MIKHRILNALVIFLGFSLVVLPVLAHHSISAEFDPSKNFTLKGTITQVDWENPHVYVHLDVKDDSGKIVNWALETYPPAVLHKGGVTRETFKPGQVVSIDAFPPKDGTKSLAYLKVIAFSDGHSIEIWVGDPDQYNR
jgi:hypothetical protein